MTPNATTIPNPYQAMSWVPNNANTGNTAQPKKVIPVAYTARGEKRSVRRPDTGNNSAITSAATAGSVIAT